MFLNYSNISVSLSYQRQGTITFDGYFVVVISKLPTAGNECGKNSQARFLVSKLPTAENLESHKQCLVILL